MHIPSGSTFTRQSNVYKSASSNPDNARTEIAKTEALRGSKTGDEFKIAHFGSTN